MNSEKSAVSAACGAEPHFCFEESADALYPELSLTIGNDGHYGMSENERIFPIVQEAVQHKMKHQMEKAGVKKIRVHDLRHSHVAYLINKGIEPILIKERVGHKDIRITLNTYGHLYPNQQRKVADMLDFEKEKSPNSGNC